MPASPERIRELVGLPEGAEIVAYCHSGSRSALATLALRCAGYDARNYAGSWHEWSRHDELPLERYGRCAPYGVRPCSEHRHGRSGLPAPAEAAAVLTATVTVKG